MFVSFTDENGKDQGINVRQKVKEMVEFVQDDDRLREERKKAKKNKDKYIGVSSDSMGGSGGGGGGGLGVGGGGGGGVNLKNCMWCGLNYYCLLFHISIKLFFKCHWWQYVSSVKSLCVFVELKYLDFWLLK